MHEWRLWFLAPLVVAAFFALGISADWNGAFWAGASAVATSFAAAVALFGQAFRMRFWPPVLSIRLKSERGEPTPIYLSWIDMEGAKQTRMEEAVYFHLTVSNARRWEPAHNVQVLLVKVEEKGGDGAYHVKWTGAAPLEWRGHGSTDTMRTIGTDADANLCNVVRSKWLALNVSAPPLNLPQQWRVACDLCVTVQARGIEADSQPLSLYVAWDARDWKDGGEPQGVTFQRR